jgi:hypothetical protein
MATGSYYKLSRVIRKVPASPLIGPMPNLRERALRLSTVCCEKVGRYTPLSTVTVAAIGNYIECDITIFSSFLFAKVSAVLYPVFCSTRELRYQIDVGWNMIEWRPSSP